MVSLDEENSAAAPAACQSRPAFPSQSDCSSTCGTTEETLKAGLLFLPVTLDLCLGFFFLSPPPVCKDERKGVDRERGRQINWKHPRVQQPYATDQNNGVQRSVRAAGSSASGQHLVSAAREEEATEKRYSTTRLDHNLGGKGRGNTETLPSKQNLPFVPKTVCHS